LDLVEKELKNSLIHLIAKNEKALQSSVQPISRYRRQTNFLIRLLRTSFKRTRSPRPKYREPTVRMLRREYRLRRVAIQWWSWATRSLNYDQKSQITIQLRCNRNPMMTTAVLKSKIRIQDI